uniref:Coiled-coil domain containing 92B n=1 Tax=Geotrypetes seraphini TaxID=260995 RepID=A0A6P8NMU5_GEOSA|nr:coiled-coil domain containing 92B [Geotrypetes seraphini]XP_033777462.1 coiled-coil domain containing 92B [Geotrypetes seraphini]
METLSLEQQIQSVQRNIAFLKKAQLELLHDLHLEILHLQKHCSELTCQLETKQLRQLQQDGIEQEMEEKCQILETKVNEKEKINSELRRELWYREALVVALQSSLRDKERKFLEELKRRSHRVTILNTELQKQTEAVAYLSFQLHSTRQKLHGSQHSGKPSDRPPDRMPPGQTVQEARPKKRIHKSHAARRQALESSFSRGIAKDSFQREQMSSFEDEDSMPDPALFLHAKKHVPPRRQKLATKTHVFNKQGVDQNDGITTHALQSPTKLSMEHMETRSIVGPSVKAKLPKKERKSQHFFTQEDSRSSE